MAQTNDEYHIPIKKKATLGDISAESEAAPFSSEQMNMSSEEELRRFQAKANEDLVNFLMKRGIEPEFAEKYKIYVRRSKKKNHHIAESSANTSSTNNQSSQSYSYSVRYASPDGSILDSKADVFESIQRHKTKTQSVTERFIANPGHLLAFRKSIYEETKLSISAYTLPHTFGKITVTNFGVIDTRPPFHNVVQLYPIGYRCEQALEGGGGFKDIPLICEINEVDELPEFRITFYSSGETFLAINEAEVWAKAFKRAEYRKPGSESFSFFNIDIELLLEGLEKSIDCEHYKFHKERGYPKEYSNQEQNMKKKEKLLLHFERERRNQERQKIKFSGGNDGQRPNESNEEDGKRSQASEKERKEKERTRIKLYKEQHKLEVAQSKKSRGDDNNKSTDGTKKSPKKKTSKIFESFHKEAKKDGEKFRAVYRKDIINEVKKNRIEAAGMVINYFDHEEELVEQIEQIRLGKMNQPTIERTSLSNSSSSSIGMRQQTVESVKEFLMNQPSLDEEIDAILKCGKLQSQQSRPAVTIPNNVSEVAASWDDVLVLMNTLHLLRNHLNLEMSTNFDESINSFKDLTPSPPIHSNTVSMEVEVVEAKVEDDVAPNVKMEITSEANPAVEVRLNKEMTISDSLAENPAGDENGIDKEDEWVDDTTNRKSLDKVQVDNNSSHGNQTAAVSFDNRREAIIDKVQLKLTQSMMKSLYILFDIHQSESVSESNPGNLKKNKSNEDKKKMKKLRFPLNQLTWSELTRLGLLNYIFNELGISKEEIQHALRGNKVINYYRGLKAMMRHLRYRLQYRWNARTSSINNVKKEDSVASGLIPFLNDRVDGEDRLALFTILKQSCQVDINKLLDTNQFNQLIVHPYVQSNLELRKQRPAFNDYASDQEIIRSLNQASEDGNLTDEYRRCCKVLLKILSLGPSKNFIWEVDSDAFPYYYSTIIRPLMFTNVATNLLNKVYSQSNAEGGMVGDFNVTAEFYRDLRQVVLNCFAFNTEHAPNVAQGLKMLQAIFRHVNQWIHSPNRPSNVTHCSDQYCMLSEQFIAQYGASGIKCGRCFAVFSVDALLSDGGKTPSLILPSTENLEQNNDEWVCCFCVSEDTVYYNNCYAKIMTQPNMFHLRDLVPFITYTIEGQPSSCISPYYLDEWGPSCIIPWLLNPAHSTLLNDISKRSAHLLSVYKALLVLANSCTSPIFDRNYICNRRTWNSSERIAVLTGLSEAVRNQPDCLDLINNIHNDCDKLLRICGKASFREADFMTVVRSLSGDEGVSLCRSLLDGIDEGNGFGDTYLQVMEGRCIVCNASTQDDEALNNPTGKEDKEDDDPVLLCDGCKAEVHLRCLNLTTVPSTDWYCPTCKDRMAARDAKIDHSFDNIDRQRFKELEEELVNSVIDLRINYKGPTSFTGLIKDLVQSSNPGVSIIDLALDEVKCAYCGFNEFELCSPFVITQSRDEHDMVVALSSDATVDDFLHDPLSKHKKMSGTTVRFLIHGKVVGMPALDFPYFPPWKSEQAKELSKMYTVEDHDSYDKKELHASAVAHQMCALQLFQARINRARHTLRRRRNLIGDRAVALSGVSNKALGYDSNGFEYWKFPVSDDLFISTPNTVDNDNEELYALIGKTMRVKNNETIPRRWWRLRGLDDIRKVVDLLGVNQSEQILKKNIINSLLLERYNAPPTATITHTLIGSKTEDTGVDQKASLEMSNGNQEDGEIDVVPIENEKNLRKSHENNPVAIRLMASKGHDIEKVYTIDQESVFDEIRIVDEDDEDGDDEEEDDTSTHFEYITYSKGKKYYAIALVNSTEKIVKPSRGAVTVIYQIHREGKAAPLGYNPLSEPWSDNLYYFSTVNFKKSGRYTISFITEGIALKPLIYPIAVHAKTVRCGTNDALDKLIASDYCMNMIGRQITYKRFELHEALTKSSDALNEVDSIRRILITIYAALPLGSLMPTATNGSILIAEKHSDSNNIADAVSWNEALDDAWRSTVMECDNPMAIMECVLLLEYYLNKQWLASPYNKLLNSLPNPHFALRGATYSAIALRLYCLDRALLYEKVGILPREKRSAMVGTEGSGNAGTGKRLDAYSLSSNRLKRNAAQDATLRIQRQSSESSDMNGTIENSINEEVDEGEFITEEGDEEDEEDDEEEAVDEEDEYIDGTDGPRVIKEQTQPRVTKWICTDCTTQNEMRARSCEGCGNRKSSVDRIMKQNKKGSIKGGKGRRGRKKGSGRPKRPRRKSRSDDDDDDDEEDDEEDSRGEDEEDDEDENNHTKRSSGRKKRVHFTHSRMSNDNESNDEEGTSSKNKRVKRSNTRKYYGEQDESENNEEEENDHDGGVVEGDEQYELNEYYQEYAAALLVKVQAYDGYIEKILKGSAADPINADLKIRYLSILRKLLSDIKSEPFWSPVDLNLIPSYRKFIKHPMDLGTIRDRVINDYYESKSITTTFLEDVRLVWKNCMTFNFDTSIIFHDAKRLSENFEKMYQDWILAEDKPTNPDIPPSQCF